MQNFIESNTLKRFSCFLNAHITNKRTKERNSTINIKQDANEYVHEMDMLIFLE